MTSVLTTNCWSAAPSIATFGCNRTVTLTRERQCHACSNFRPRHADAKQQHDGPLPLAALEFESPSAAIIATPVPALSRATNLFVFLLVVSLLVASGIIRIDKIVSAGGKLVAEASNIVIQPFDRTIVESIDVRQGDTVHKGQVLARLNPTFTDADYTAIKDQADLLDAQAARLQAETASLIYLPDQTNPHSELQASIFSQRASEYKHALQSYDQKINQLKIQIAGDDLQATTIESGSASRSRSRACAKSFRITKPAARSTRCLPRTLA